MGVLVKRGVWVGAGPGFFFFFFLKKMNAVLGIDDTNPNPETAFFIYKKKIGPDTAPVPTPETSCAY